MSWLSGPASPPGIFPWEPHAGPEAVVVDTSEADLERLTIRLSMAIIIVACVLQRFVIPLAGSFTSLVGPVAFMVVGYGMFRGAFRLDRRRLVLWFVFATLAMIGAAVNMAQPPPFNVPLSLASVFQMLALSSFATVGFSSPVSEARFFRAVNLCLALLALAGLLQFVLQFVGLGLFHFNDFIPAQFLTEQSTGGGYNNEIPITYGADLFKSNGFFLAEPSVFSQFMAVAIAIELTSFRRRAYLFLFIAALLSSASGTGWIVLIVFLATVAFSMGRKGLLMVFGVFLAMGVALLAWSVVLPEFFATFAGRSGETSEVGSSGYIRFVGPWIVANAVLARSPLALLYGVGFGVSEKVPLAVEVSVNSPVKIALESGLPALLCYTGLIAIGWQTPKQLRLVPAILALLFLTGGYAQFPPVLFPMLLIMSIAQLKQDPPDDSELSLAHA